MSSRILLLNVNRCKSPYPVYPLGISHLAATLRKRGHTVFLGDINIHGEKLKELIEGCRADMVGLSLRNIDTTQMDRERFFVPDLQDAVKAVRLATDAPVVVGGSAFSLFPERILEFTGADYGIHGEGEAALSALVEALEKGEAVDTIPGLVYREDGRVKKNEKTDCAVDEICPAVHPDELVKYYLDSSLMLNLQTQRGCAFRCCYCTYPLIEGRNFRRRKPEAIADELSAACGKGCSYFFIADSVFNTSAEHVAGVCEEILRRDLRMHWGCFLRPKNLTNEIMALMSRAGLRHVEFGTDSFCDTVLDAYGKNFSFDDVMHSNEMALQNNIRAAHFLIFGGPSESEQTMKESFTNSQSLRRTVIFASTGMRLYPETPLYDHALREGSISENTDLLRPYYYSTPGISEQRVFELLQDFRRQSRRWLINEPTDHTLKIMNSLRSRGVKGPLWEFMAG
ncbi:MAG: lipid biosynthesis B12-binding/radical SAM protein [Fibrobacterota bacterium]